ncbi:P-loop NTPase family protein [Anaerocolumna xylanovorans]|uniref:Tetratricopeptide repeat-containing protein n=1 Tax=Anaerocolumna xylanovorans DSM 12503 TaxID=1121345 RepID=A0A1M7YK70_9FIRM|nr:hypothetical protein [Anaerocolumna xylanovorans]SHO53031.1 hypothetical protein SAMN02745217_03925 [Anaerocolumna xylanovorans DSM 12503]
MERYDNIVKIEEIRKLTDEGQYQKAVKILDTMDLRRIKSLTDLSILADVLTETERYDEAMELLYRIYEKSKTRRVLYQMVELSIKRGDVDQAEECFLKYKRSASDDSYCFIFRYYIDKLKGEPADVLIDSLEQLKEYEYIEVWAYELAKLYHKAGMKDKCVRECSDIILWFGDGIYVEKAKLLKAYYVGEIDPVHILKAKDKNETRQRLGLDKTKDYRNIREQINEYLAEEEKEEDTEDSYAEPEDTQTGEEEETVIIKADKKEEPVTEEKQGEEEPESAKTENAGLENPEPERIEQDAVEPESTEHSSIEAQSAEPDRIEQDDMEPQSTELDRTEPDALTAESIFSLFEKASFDYQRELGGFLQSEEIKEQFRYCLENILSDSANTKFLCISGEKESGKTSLALKICKVLYCLNWIKTDRIAKITGEKLNKIDILKQKEKLYGSSLIIENPGEIQAETAQRLYAFFQETQDNIFAVMEGTKDEITDFLDNYPYLKEYFAYEISLAPYSLKQLVFFAKQYLENNNYKLKDETKEEFVKILKEAQAACSDREAYGETMRLAVKAKKAADKRYKSLLGDILNSGKLTEEDLLYIIKEDLITEEI